MTRNVIPNRARRWTQSLVTGTVMLLAAMLLAACATGGGPTRVSRDPASSAQQAYELGQYDLALEDFLTLAQRSPEQADRWRLRAADSAWLLGDENLAVDLLQQLDPQRLSPVDRRFVNLLLLLAGEINPSSIGVRLAMLGRPEGWPAPYQPQVHRLRGRALAQNGQPYRAAQELIAFGQSPLAPQTARENRAEILRTLTPLSARRALDLLSQHQPEDEMYGWLALVADIKNSLFAGAEARRDLPPGSVPSSQADLAETLAAWRLRFPSHPGASDSLDDLLGGAPVQSATPDRVAVLLPFSGRFPAAARAVRDGLLSAYFDDSRRRAQIQFYDTGSDPETAVSMYRRAITDGADQIIGPLERDAVTAVLLEADGSTPVLALNHQGSAAPPAPGNLQFGLLPEEEARSIARHMINDGLLRVAVMTASDAWGQRVSNAFVEHFDRLGGVVLEVQQFQPLAQDFGAQVSALLGTTSAELRRRQLARAFRFSVGFEAFPRHDLDAVFLAARAAPARLIKPQLAFFNAGDIPVYATSHVFDGKRDRNRNRDLDGITFCDAPFLLDPDRFTPSAAEAEATFADLGGIGSRLFALGMDAYRVLPYLNLLRSMGTEAFPGATGQLSMDAGGYLYRNLSCAQIRGGRVELRQAQESLSS
ncbi:MAG: penicillin-binding protein activator [Pseudomonadota bacterium]